MTNLIDSLEQVLAQAHQVRGGTTELPVDEPSLDDAYTVQRRLHGRTNLPVMLWKLALTTPGAREAHGAAEPVAGRLPASAIYTDRSHVDFVGTEMFAEAELVLELGTDLPPTGAPYDRASVAGAIKGVYAGIEICRTRFATSGLPLGFLVADNAMAHGLVLGARLSTGWDEAFADHPITLGRNATDSVEGRTSRAHGHPLDALAWLANWACRTGEGGLLREQLIATGSCTGVTEVFNGDTLDVTLDDRIVARATLSAL